MSKGSTFGYELRNRRLKLLAVLHVAGNGDFTAEEMFRGCLGVGIGGETPKNNGDHQGS